MRRIVPSFWVGTAPESGDYHGRPVQRDERRLIHLVLRGPSRKAVTEFHLRGRENGRRYSGVPEDSGKGCFAGYLLRPDGSNNIEAGVRMEAEL